MFDLVLELQVKIVFHEALLQTNTGIELLSTHSLVYTELCSRWCEQGSFSDLCSWFIFIKNYNILSSS